MNFVPIGKIELPVFTSPVLLTSVVVWACAPGAKPISRGRASGTATRNGWGARLSSAEARADPKPRPSPWAVESQGRQRCRETTESSHPDGEASGRERPEGGHNSDLLITAAAPCGSVSPLSSRQGHFSFRHIPIAPRQSHRQRFPCRRPRHCGMLTSQSSQPSHSLAPAAFTQTGPLPSAAAPQQPASPAGGGYSSIFVLDRLHGAEQRSKVIILHHRPLCNFLRGGAAAVSAVPGIFPRKLRRCRGVGPRRTIAARCRGVP